MEMATTNQLDLISALPIQMLQNILSSLPTVDAVRLSTLSRTLLYAWNSLPLFTFHFSCQTEHEQDTSILVSKFHDTISILNEKQEPLPVSFRVSWPYLRTDYSYVDCVYEWMRLVSKHRVRELEIDALLEEHKYGDNERTFDLPHETLFSGAESLVVLKLRAFPMLWQSLRIQNTNLVSLRVLFWEDYFNLEEHDDLEELLPLCPVLEECTLVSIWHRQTYFLLDHRKLKRVKLDGFYCVIFGDLPNLQELELSEISLILECDDSDRYTGLKKLTLIPYRYVDYDRLRSFIHKLPSLESLVVKSDGSSRISISELGIQNFSFPSSVEPPKMEIHAPMLDFYEYGWSVLPPTSFETEPFAFRSIHLVLTLDKDIGNTVLLFKSLRSNLVNLAAYNLLLKVTFNAKKFLPNVLPPIDGHTPVFVDSLELQDIPSSFMCNVYLIKWFFWCCPPLQLSTRPSIIFLQSFRSMIYDAKLRGNCCNCTCPSLRAVKVEAQYGIKDFKDIKINEDSELLSEDVLKFRLEWL